MGDRLPSAIPHGVALAPPPLLIFVNLNLVGDQRPSPYSHAARVRTDTPICSARRATPGSHRNATAAYAADTDPCAETPVTMAMTASADTNLRASACSHTRIVTVPIVASPDDASSASGCLALSHDRRLAEVSNVGLVSSLPPPSRSWSSCLWPAHLPLAVPAPAAARLPTKLPCLASHCSLRP